MLNEDEFKGYLVVSFYITLYRIGLAAVDMRDVLQLVDTGHAGLSPA